MYIVNTSFMVEPPVHDRWYEMITGQVIPHMKREGFGELIFTRVLTDSGDPHYTYSLQVPVPDTGEYRRFMQDVMGEYNGIAGPVFGERVLHFTSLMKKIMI